MEPRKHEHPPCTFCELIKGSAEVSICHEDADAIAFMDIQPVNNGHVLVVPREHHESLLEVPEALGLHLFKVTMRLTNAIRSVSGCEDFNIVVNSGKAAGQDEPHYHIHIIPRRDGDGFNIPLPFDGSEMPDRTVLDAYAVRIISALRDPVRAGGGLAGPSEGGEAHEVRGAHAASTTEESLLASPSNAERQTEAWRADRQVDLATFSESSRAELADVAPRGPERRPEGRWLVEEGAHGELRYEPLLEVDAPG